MEYETDKGYYAEEKKMYVYKNKSRKGKPLFDITEYRLKIGEREFLQEDIEEINVTGNLGKIFPVRKNFDRIDELCELPVISELSGWITIKTKNEEFVFDKVFDVMVAGVVLKRFYMMTNISYKFRNKERKHKFDGELEEDELENNTYAIVLVFKDGKKISHNDIIEMGKKWVNRCGYRFCDNNEASSYTMYRFSSDSEEWIANYDDSVENLNTIGLKDQLKSYSEEFMGMPVVAVCVYDKGAILIGYAKNGSDFRYYVSDKDEKFKESLKYNDEIISKDYSVLEELRKNKDYAVEEIMKDESISTEKKMEMLAYAFGIEKRFFKTGFYGLTYLSDVSKYYFGMGYEIFEERIRVDEKRMDDFCWVMHDGMPAFDLYEGKDIIRNNEDYEISFLNIGDCSKGFIFFVSSEEIHNMIMNNIQGGECGIEIKDMRLIRVKEEINTKEKFETEKDIYEEIPMEGEYKRIWGKYAYIFEDNDIFIPNGLIINKNMIKSDEDKKTLKWLTEKCKVSVKFKIEAKAELINDIEITAGPLFNMHCGFARKNIKFVK